MAAFLAAFDWLAQADGVIQGTAALLLAMSVASWAVILFQSRLLWRARRELAPAVAAFWQAGSLAAAAERARPLDSLALVTPLAQAALQATRPATDGALHTQGALEVRLTRALRGALAEAAARLSWGQTLLASVGATAPFVGLLGTVWGIYHALSALAGSGQVGVEQLAGPVGEALVMTAAGLAVAIPAVLAYNGLARAAGRVEARLEGFARDLRALLAGSAGEE